MSKFIIGAARNQIPLFVSSMDQTIAQDNPVRLVDLFVDILKLADYGFDLSFVKMGYIYFKNKLEWKLGRVFRRTDVGNKLKKQKPMIHLIWSIINGMIVLYFLYLIFGFIVKGNRIFKPQFKVVSIFIMVIGVVQIISASNSEKNTNRIIINDEYNQTNSSTIKNVILEDNLTFDIYMLVKYSMDKNEFIPIESNSFLTGFVSGYIWEFKSIQTNNYKPNEKSKYIADGVLKWNLFGITIYSESKTFSGIIE